MKPYTQEEIDARREFPLLDVETCEIDENERRWLATVDALQARLAAAEAAAAVRDALLARSRTYVDEAATASDDADTSYYASLPEVRAPAIALLDDIDTTLRGDAGAKEAPRG